MNETLLDPELAAAAGRRISAAAATAKEVVPGLVERVRAGCAARPWGGDAAGRACDDAFSSIPRLLDRVAGAVEAVATFGDNIVRGAQGTLATDLAARDTIVATGIRSA
ncbi:hypothetical protein ND748_23295 [Frankia sp. AiPs1]|uniref:hypothetical protein n=1 Tax=Frankia sp. AiPs1 TaxID=573493 RepID=UPI0020441ADC|nr:hypothetical protein [Frankia sp. AiPs1]MCM3924577.1 hypothetical protein [Frankia sp. AiPs1]